MQVLFNALAIQVLTIQFQQGLRLLQWSKDAQELSITAELCFVGLQTQWTQCCGTHLLEQWCFPAGQDLRTWFSLHQVVWGPFYSFIRSTLIPFRVHSEDLALLQECLPFVSSNASVLLGRIHSWKPQINFWERESNFELGDKEIDFQDIIPYPTTWVSPKKVNQIPEVQLSGRKWELFFSISCP